MTPADGSREIDLSGAWTGLYTLPSDPEPVFFDCQLTEADGFLSGDITETVSDSGRRRTLQSVLQGRRLGRSLKWLKLYEGTLPGYDSVQYDGGINEDATEIEGRWAIPGNWSGSFLMIRAGSRQAVRARRVFVRV